MRVKDGKSKRRKRTNLLIASVAVLIMVAGIGLVGLTWFYDDVKPPTELGGEPETTTILYKNGQQLAKLGKQNRSIVPVAKISPVVKHAILAAEDKGFYEHGGVDVKGIARAAWNNFTGGTTQGASTITQQYARHAADLSGITYGRKIREAVMASKLEQQYDKDTILGYYLNAVYFGRGAHGIEAAAQTYFGKSTLTPPGQRNALTPEEAAVLAAVIKQPEPDDATGHKGYDPQINLEAAQGRWNYTLNNMVEKGWLTPQQRAAAKYPTTIRKWDPKTNCAVDCGINTPAGNVVNYVRTELEAMGIKDWQKGGYRISTTLDPRAQQAAVAAAQKTNKKSPLYELSRKYMAALVSVEPATGRVLAYYGGDTGTGTDYAGLNVDDKSGRLFGGHQPGSTFKVYTLSAALRKGISFQSHWDATLTKDPDTGFEISNANRTPKCAKSCTLEYSTIQSYNVPFYWIAKRLGPAMVVEAARDAGVRTMWSDKLEAVNLAKADPADVAPSRFDNHVGFGQYQITVLDHANGLATITNRGVYNKAHFVQSVERRDATGKWARVNGEQLKPRQVFETAQMDALNGVLQKIPGSIDNKLADGRPATGKTGTWQFGTSTKDNAHAWMIGATPQMATAVWVGNAKGDGPIKEANGKPMGGSGTPAAIWEQYMDDAHAALSLEKEEFPPPKDVGDPDTEYATGVSPPPVEPQQPKPNCDPLQLLCTPGGNNDGRGNGGGGRGGGILPTRPPTG